MQAQLQQAIALHQKGALDQAAALYERILAADPRHVVALHLSGVVALQRQDFARAIELIGKAIGLKPDYADAYCNRGIALAALKRDDAAMADYTRAIALKPTYAEAHYNRGNLQKDSADLKAAIASYDKAIAFNPRYVKAYSNRGVARLEMGRAADALADFDAAIAHAPAFAEAYMNRGFALHELRRLGDAIAAFDRVIALDAKLADAHFGRGVSLLLDGRLAEGWRGYEWRWKRAGFLAEHPPCPEPRWQGGQDLAGRSILLHSEQGLGDTIQFCRYAKMVADLGATVSVEVQPALIPLLKELDPRIALLPRGSSSPDDFDLHCPLLSLPLLFATELATIPAGVPYLQADAARAAKWADRIGTEGFRIGICWQGQTGKVDAGRSYPLRELLPVVRVPGIRLISLQKGVGLAQLEDLPPDMRVETLGDDFDAGGGAFLDTVAVIRHCDLVITSDTSIAHLAGALGAPAWVALKHVPEWRWLLDRDQSPWYPSLRLFRQAKPGDWAGVFAKMAEAIAVQVSR